VQNIEPEFGFTLKKCTATLPLNDLSFSKTAFSFQSETVSAGAVRSARSSPARALLLAHVTVYSRKMWRKRTKRGACENWLSNGVCCFGCATHGGLCLRVRPPQPPPAFC
jgi:hypothetical protein